jgi:hypothetical protein
MWNFTKAPCIVLKVRVPGAFLAVELDGKEFFHG